jgi:hypothetical protein
MGVVDVFGREDLASDVNALRAGIRLYQVCKLLHVYFGVVADGKAVVQTEHLMPENAFRTVRRCLVLIKVLLCLLAHLYLADLVVRVQQLIRDVASVNHKLHLRSQLPLCDEVGVVCLHFEHQQYY